MENLDRKASSTGKRPTKKKGGIFLWIKQNQCSPRNRRQRDHAYTPYSHFHVGAALLTKEGKVYQGCNIENAAYSPSVCAERTAFFKAVYEGERNFKAIAIMGGPETVKGPDCDICAPCGICRQVMMEFCDPGIFEILLGTPEKYEIYTLKEILPLGFGSANLEKK